MRWALAALVAQHLTIAEGACVIAVDERVWRHTQHGERYVTVVSDLTPIRDGTGSARLLDMVEGRSMSAFTSWLAVRPKTWREGIEVVAMDGFTRLKTAADEELPATTAAWTRSTS